MTKKLQRLLRPRFLLTLVFVLGLVLLLCPARVTRSDNFVLYMPNARQVVPITVINNAKYLPVLQILNAVGKVAGLAEKKNSLKIWFGKTEVELHQKDAKIKVRKDVITLKNPVLVEGGQWMVPVDFLISTLTELTHQPVDFQVGSNRIFIGDVRPASFSVRLEPLPSGARVNIQFTDKVMVRTVSSDGKWIIFLGDRPIEPLEPSFHFQNPYVSDLQFDDQDGIPKLILTPSTPGLNFNPLVQDEGKALLAEVTRPASVVAEQNPPAEPTPANPAPPPPGAPTSGTRSEAPAVPTAGGQLAAVVLDAGHGGPDIGARSRDGVLEKDLVAQLAAQVRLELLSTKKFRVVLTRLGDVNPTFDQRQATANLVHSLVFLTFHAGNLGTRTPHAVAYAYEPASWRAGAPAQAPLQLFVPWGAVQQLHLEQSRRFARALQRQFGQAFGTEVDRPWRAPVRTLRSVDAPGAAVEVGSLSPDSDAGPLTSPGFQQRVSSAIVQALENFRSAS